LTWLDVFKLMTTRWSCGFLSIFTDDEILQLLASVSSPAQEPPVLGPQAARYQEDLASLYLMIAIGARCRGADELDSRCSTQYFAQGQRMAFRDMLHNPSLGMATNFLLMAFYMLCASRRNTVLIYLGVATNTAVVLGLYII
jgi:hypothetical protein